MDPQTLKERLMLMTAITNNWRLSIWIISGFVEVISVDIAPSGRKSGDHHWIRKEMKRTGVAVFEGGGGGGIWV